jgi:hypothetical protein
VEAKTGGKRGESGYIFWQSGLHVLIEGGNGILQHPCLLTDQTDGGGMRRMKEQITTRICEWCAESIPAVALRCPRCQKWRKDIENDIIISRTFAIAGTICLIFILLGIMGAIDGIIEKGVRWKETEIEILGSRVPTTYGYITPVGITPVGFILIAGCIISFAVYTYYYIKASRKMGTWWWF